MDTQQEIQLLRQEVESLKQIVNKFVYPDKYFFERAVKLNDKIGFFGKEPTKRATTGNGATGYMTTPGGTNVQEGSKFYGNLAYYNGGLGSSWSIPDLVTELKDKGFLPK